jgi:WhiB family transcriptional regulator, redox-sensing transcriptional regulator
MATVVTDPSRSVWMAEGACRDHDPEVFFPRGTGVAGAAQARHATSICRKCDVAAECLRYALVNHVKHGIWGGRTEQERSAMSRGRRYRRTPRRRSRP